MQPLGSVARREARELQISFVTVGRKNRHQGGAGEGRVNVYIYPRKKTTRIYFDAFNSGFNQADAKAWGREFIDRVKPRRCRGTWSKSFAEFSIENEKVREALAALAEMLGRAEAWAAFDDGTSPTTVVVEGEPDVARTTPPRTTPAMTTTPTILAFKDLRRPTLRDGQQWGRWQFHGQSGDSIGLRWCLALHPIPGDPESLLYYVDLEKITTGAQLADWVFQVTCKTFLTDTDRADFLRALDELLSPQRHLCSFGENKKADPVKIIKAKLQKEETKA